jgi:hypothetical protein
LLNRQGKLEVNKTNAHDRDIVGVFFAVGATAPG